MRSHAAQLRRCEVGWVFVLCVEGGITHGHVFNVNKITARIRGVFFRTWGRQRSVAGKSKNETLPREIDIFSSMTTHSFNITNLLRFASALTLIYLGIVGKREHEL